MANICYQLLIIIVCCGSLIGCSSDQPDATWMHDERGIYAAQLSDDGEYLLIATINKAAQLWDFQQNTKLHIWTHAQTGHSELAHAVISADGTTAVTADHHNIVTWDTKSGKSTGFWALPDYIIKIKLSENGRFALVAYGNRSVQLLDLRYGDSLWAAKHAAYIETIDLSADANYAMVGCDDNTATFWDIKNGKRLHLWEEKSLIRYVAISPNNKYALTSAPYQPVKIWDVQSGELYRELREYPGLLSYFSKALIQVSSATFSDEEDFLLIGSPPRNVYLWNLNTGELLHKFMLPKHKIWQPTSAIIYATALSDDNKTAYAEASNGIGYAWQVATDEVE